MNTTVILSLFIFILIFFVYKAYANTKDVIINNIQYKLIEPNEPHINLLQISDMHLENISISPDKLYNQLKDNSIDLITITGDLLDRKRSFPKLISYLKVFNQLKPKHGIYVVFGNHDYVLREKDLAVMKHTLEQHGCKVLQNEHDSLDINGDILNIIGVDDSSTKRSDLVKSFENVKTGYNLVITHDPNIVMKMKNYHFDYLLAGHFHGGQIHWPKPYHLAKLGREMMKMNMVKGLHYYDDKPFYISEGLGQTGVNLRIGSRPEITHHKLSINNITKKVTSTAI
ncbi:metallophosphoesterase [Aquibacillus saliphilus]|uniref:metallophosphoesterase n=1 Tax=Aquibacillus saliphilus TaxID=1909422 RepID=UPI001CF01E6E|nr:metallophosphoesterase [Aquibacillus saliphilus]